MWVRLQRYADGLPAPMPHELVAEEDRLAEEQLAEAAGLTVGADVGGPRIVPAFPRRR